MAICKCSVIYRICANLLKRLSSGLAAVFSLPETLSSMMPPREFVHIKTNNDNNVGTRAHEIKGENLNMHYG